MSEEDLKEDQREEFSDNDDYEEEKPLQAGAYNSETKDETLAEIKSMDLKDKPLTKMQFIKKRKDFGLGWKYSDQETSERMGEVKSSDKDPLGQVKNKVIDMGIQGCSQAAAAGTQTLWNRKINKGLQIDEGDEQTEQPEEDFELLKFLESVYPLMEEALQSNETIDIYQDDFNVLPNSESNENAAGEMTNVIKEIKSFTYLNCKGKKISCIQFQPTNQGMKSKFIVAESFVENLTFDDRVIYQLKSRKSLIVFWDFEDIHSIEPVLILQSPLEILCFEFNAKDPNIIIGGSMNGQVFMWDLSGTALSVFASKKTQKTKQEKNEIQELLPKQTSVLQDPASYQALTGNEILRKGVASHKGPVLSIKWFPLGMEFDKKSFHHVNLTNSNENYQFATISQDGQILFWDTRLVDKDSKKSMQDVSTIPWKASYGVQLYRPEGGGQMGGSQLTFRKNQKNPMLTGTSDEGELFIFDWGEKPGEENQKNQLVSQIWGNFRNVRPPVGLDVSPFYDDIILTLHDFNFSVWKHNVPLPLFESMIVKNAHITCGGFSPFRAAVIIVGKTDGNLDVWDLLDQSHKWTVQFPVVAQAITSLRFHEFMPHIMAVGDIDGTLHLIEFPQSLCKDQGNESKSMKTYWDREVTRVEYYQERFKIREEEAKKEQDREQILAQQAKDNKSQVDQSDKSKELFKQIQEVYIKYIEQFEKPKEEPKPAQQQKK